MQTLGFKVQSLFVRSSLGGHEMSADQALRVSLRLGESAIVLGEVRGQEARTLYEAMRAGTAGSSVLGTIHGSSSQAVYERVVHDLGIPAASFAATDVVVVTGLVRPGGSQRTMRRVFEVTDLQKTGPASFHRLLEYDPATDSLLAPGLATSERIRTIADAWSLTMEEALEDIRARASIRSILVDRGAKDGEFLRPSWVARANAAYWALVDEGCNAEKLSDAWTTWFEEASRA